MIFDINVLLKVAITRLLPKSFLTATHLIQIIENPNEENIYGCGKSSKN